MVVPLFFAAIGLVHAATIAVCLGLAWYTWTRARWADVYPGGAVTERTLEIHRVGVTAGLVVLTVVPVVSLVDLYGILASVRTGGDVAASALPLALAADQFPSGPVRTAAFLVAGVALLAPVALALRDWLDDRAERQVP